MQIKIYKKYLFKIKQKLDLTDEKVNVLLSERQKYIGSKKTILSLRSKSQIRY
jgi:chorismate mutase